MEIDSKVQLVIYLCISSILSLSLMEMCNDTKPLRKEIKLGYKIFSLFMLIVALVISFFVHILLSVGIIIFGFTIFLRNILQEKLTKFMEK